jgi:hypothetical protein
MAENNWELSHVVVGKNQALRAYLMRYYLLLLYYIILYYIVKHDSHAGIVIEEHNKLFIFPSSI